MSVVERAGRLLSKRRAARVASTIASSSLLTLGLTGMALAAGPGEIPKPPGSNPGDRGYEKVTPADKGGVDVGGVQYPARGRSAPAGGELLFSSIGAFADVSSAAFPHFYFGRRGAEGWSVKSALPRSQATLIPWKNSSIGRTAMVLYVDDSLETEIVETAAPVVPGAIAGVPAIYRRDKTDGNLSLLTPGGPGFALAAVAGFALQLDLAPAFETATPDGEHVLFNSAWRYPDAAELPSYDPDDQGRMADCELLYMAEGGTVALVGKLPNGDPARCAHAGSYMVSTHNAISDDGSRVYFTQDELLNTGTSGPLYLNEDGVTVEIAPSDAMFFTATPDGSRAIYRRGVGLYMYDAEQGTSELLSGSGSVTNVLGVSDDLSYVYFNAITGISSVEPSTGGGPGIYVWREGELSHVATLGDDRDASATGPAWAPYAGIPNVNGWINQPFLAWTPDGRSLVFDTSARVTDYDAGGFRQVYRYDADTGALSCLSCPDGPATADAVLNPTWVGDRAPLTQIGTTVRPLGPRGNITPDGSRVFFETGDALVGGDTNGRDDVYVWEGGRPHLVSDGKSGFDARFVAASESGDDAFFATAAPLVASDTDSLVDIYDARVGGGFAEPRAVLPRCSGDGCQGPPSSPVGRSVPGTAGLGVSGRSAGEGLGGLGRARASVRAVASGRSVTVRVRVPGRGRIVVSGAGVRRSAVTAGAAGAYRVKVRLSRSGAQALGRDGRVAVRLSVRFAPARGDTQSQRLRVTFKRARQGGKAGRTARSANAGSNGGR